VLFGHRLISSTSGPVTPGAPWNLGGGAVTRDTTQQSCSTQCGSALPDSLTSSDC
jgi:hypothetical protein